MGRITTKCYSTYTVSYFYDVLGRKTAYLDPQGNLFTYTYDADNQLISLNNWTNQTTSYSYDALGEETAEYYPNGTRMNYYYDVLGELTSIQFSYAPVGEQTTMRMNPYHNVVGGPTSIQFSNNYAYGQTSSILLNAGSLETSTNYGLQLAIGDTVIGQSTSANYTVHWGLGEFNYVNTSTIQVLAYAYDSVGNRTLQVDLSNNSTFYYYDILYRLTTEQRIGTNAYTRIYTYDPAGNRTQMLILSDSTSTTTYILNNLNQITVSTTNGVETLYSYDANGNLLSKGSTSYLWNKDNQLISVFLSNDTVSYLYDSLGRRSQRIHGNSTTNYQLEGLDTQVELDNSTVQRTYTLSGGLTGQIISVRHNNADYFYHYDAIGNVLFITDASGAIVTAYTQEGFGNVLATLSNFSNSYHLTTKEQDPVTGLYYFGARWYDPQVGRWLSREPTGQDGPNLYRFGFNNPVNGFDPNGLSYIEFFRGDDMIGTLYVFDKDDNLIRSIPAGNQTCGVNPKTKKKFTPLPDDTYTITGRPRKAYSKNKKDITLNGKLGAYVIPINDYTDEDGVLHDALRIHGGRGNFTFPHCTNGCIRISNDDAKWFYDNFGVKSGQYYNDQLEYISIETLDDPDFQFLVNGNAEFIKN